MLKNIRGNSYSEDLAGNLGLFCLFCKWATEANNDWETASRSSAQTTFSLLPHVGSIGSLMTPSIWAGKRGASFGKAQPTIRGGKKMKMLHPGTCIWKFWNWIFFPSLLICSSNQSAPQRRRSPGTHPASKPASAEGPSLRYMQILLEAGNHLTYEVPVSYTQAIHLIYMYSAACLFA